MKSFSNQLGVVASALTSDLRQAPRLARQLGFSGLLVDASSRNLNLSDLSSTGRRELIHLFSNDDQKLIGLQLELGGRGLAPGSDVDGAIWRIDRALQAAAGLGAPLVCVDLGPLPQPAVAPQSSPSVSPEHAGLILIPEPVERAPKAEPSPPPDPAFVAQVQSALAEVGARADRYNVMIAFSSTLASFAALHQAVQSVRCPWFGIDLDPVAVLRDAQTRDQILSASGPLIRHVRARDAVVGEDKRTKPAPVGRGDTKWTDLLTLLDEGGYTGFITLDPSELSDRGAAAVSGAKYLRLLASS